MLMPQSPEELAARSALLTAAASARAMFSHAIEAFESLAANAPIGDFAAWIAAGGDATAADSAAGAFIAGLAARAAPELVGRLEELARDGVAVCFFGNSLVAPRPDPGPNPAPN